MKKRLFGVVIFALILAMLLPVSALALKSSAGIGSAPGAAGTREAAKAYEIKFGKEHKLGNNDKWDVYTAPDLNAVRGANGKAMLHTSDRVDSAGWKGAWLLVRYGKSNGGYRVGWVPKSELGRSHVEATRSVKIANWDVTLKHDCMLTDDPLMESETLAYASAGETLVYMSYYCYQGGQEYAYVYGELNDQPICGFIPFDAIDW